MQVALIEVVANALYYNPAMTLALLDSLKATESVFKVWFKLLNDDKFESLHDKVSPIGPSFQFDNFIRVLIWGSRDDSGLSLGLELEFWV